MAQKINNIIILHTDTETLEIVNESDYYDNDGLPLDNKEILLLDDKIIKDYFKDGRNNSTIFKNYGELKSELSKLGDYDTSMYKTEYLYELSIEEMTALDMNIMDSFDLIDSIIKEKCDKERERVLNEVKYFCNKISNDLGNPLPRILEYLKLLK